MHYRNKNNNDGATLIFDSYYTTNVSRVWWNQNNVQYIGSVCTIRFSSLMDNMKLYGDRVRKPGEKTGIYNNRTGEIFVHQWDIDDRIGRKYVLSNDFEQCTGTTENSAVLPAYDHYKIRFNECDLFNLKLKDKQLCHKSGGRSKSGCEGHIHKFFMDCVLQNTFNLHQFLKLSNESSPSFQTLCLELISQLILHTLSI